MRGKRLACRRRSNLMTAPSRSASSWAPSASTTTRRQHVNGILAGLHVADDLIAAQFAGAHRFQAFGEILNRIGVHLGRRSGQAFLDRFLASYRRIVWLGPSGLSGPLFGKHRGDQPVARIVDIPRPRPKHAFVIRSRVTGGLRARIGARERRCQHIAVPKPELIRIRAHNGRVPHRHGAEQPGAAVREADGSPDACPGPPDRREPGRKLRRTRTTPSPGSGPRAALHSAAPCWSADT